MRNQTGWLALVVAGIFVVATAMPASAQKRAEVERDPKTGQLSATLDVQGGGQSTVSFEAQVTFDPVARTVEECHLLEAVGHVSGDGCGEE